MLIVIIDYVLMTNQWIIWSKQKCQKLVVSVFCCVVSRENNLTFICLWGFKDPTKHCIPTNKLKTKLVEIYTKVSYHNYKTTGGFSFNAVYWTATGNNGGQLLFLLPSQLCFANYTESNGCNQGISFKTVILFYFDFSFVHLKIKQ